MKPIILLPALLLLGSVTGGGAAYAVQRLMMPAPPPLPAPSTRLFVAASRILAPLVMRDGRLSGYVSFDIALEVEVEHEALVTQQLPILLHAINMRTYRAPLAAGPDGMLPDIAALRRVVAAAAPDAFGAGVVHRVAITRAEPT